jgi:hypothetical protein
MEDGGDAQVEDASTGVWRHFRISPRDRTSIAGGVEDGGGWSTVEDNGGYYKDQ